MDLIQKLTESGFVPSSSRPEAVAAAVRAFQAAHGLVVDGVVGPKTTAALYAPPSTGGHIMPGWMCDEMTSRLDLRPVLALARAEIGVSEDPPGSNRGPRVDVYTRPVVGIPWCAAFVSFCYAQRLGGSPFGRINGTHDMYDWGRRTGHLVPSGSPLAAGDIFFIPTSDTHGHVGLVCSPHSYTSEAFSTIEGNSGNAVWGRVRPMASIAAFIRPVPFTSPLVT